MSEFEKAWSSLEELWRIEGSGKQMPRTPIYSFLRWTIPPFLRFFLRLRISGSNRVPKKGPAILAANHLSHVDPILVIISARRKAFYMAKEGHFSNFALAAFMRATGQIKTERASGAADALSRAVDVLNSGAALGIFPEGTRSKNSEEPFLLPGKTGVARLAASMPDTPVLPIAICGSREMMIPQTHKLPRPWKRVQLNYGKGVSWHQWLAENNQLDDIKAIAEMDEPNARSAMAGLFRRFTDDLMEKISGLGAP